MVESSSCNPETGKNEDGYSVVPANDALVAQPLTSNISAQAAELTALTEVY